MTAEKRLALFAGDPHDCAYLDDRLSTLHYVNPGATLDPALFGALLQLGFRRSGSFVYRPGCSPCRRCIAARIPVDGFVPNRNQRRTLRRNADLAVSFVPAQLTDEHVDLYGRYIADRHPGGGMDAGPPGACRDFLLADWCDTRLLDLRLDGRLVSTAVTDTVPGGLSAIYTFFDPDLAQRSLGTFSVLAQIDRAAALGARHLYLGYWISGSPKMQYKERFRPIELLVDGNWTRYEAGKPLPYLP